MNGVFDIMSQTDTSWSGVACGVVLYITRTAKAVAARIPDQVSS